MTSECRCTTSQTWIFGWTHSCRVLSRLGPFPSNTQAPKGPGLSAWKGCLKGIGCLWRALHVRYLHPLKAALPKSTVARFSRLFGQQACLYIHKLTPLDLRSTALAYLLWMRSLRCFFWSVSKLSVARWGSWLRKVRSTHTDKRCAVVVHVESFHNNRITGRGIDTTKCQILYVFLDMPRLFLYLFFLVLFAVFKKKTQI